MYLTPPLSAWVPLEFCKDSGALKLEWCIYQTIKIWRYVQSFRYSTGIGQTDRQICHNKTFNNIALCMHTRDKNPRLTRRPIITVIKRFRLFSVSLTTTLSHYDQTSLCKLFNGCMYEVILICENSTSLVLILTLAGLFWIVCPRDRLWCLLYRPMLLREPFGLHISRLDSTFWWDTRLSILCSVEAEIQFAWAIFYKKVICRCRRMAGQSAWLLAVGWRYSISRA